jgi:hypothetical protein
MCSRIPVVSLTTKTGAVRKEVCSSVVGKVEGECEVLP